MRSAPFEWGDPVGDHDQGLVPAQAAQVVDDRGFGAGVHGRKRVVQDHHRAVLHERARNGGPLFLSARQRDAPLSDHLPVPFGEGGHVSRKARELRRFPHQRVVRRAVPPHGDVLRQRPGEEERRLGDDADLAKERGRLHVADVDAVDENRPARRLHEPRENVDEGGFPASDGARDANELPAPMERLTSLRTGFSWPG